MKELTKEEMLNINGGSWGVLGKFFDRATTLEAPGSAPYFEKPDFSKKGNQYKHEDRDRYKGSNRHSGSRNDREIHERGRNH